MKLNELCKRRKALASSIGKDSIAILSSANRNYRSRDVENPFRQESDFLYMTGISEPNLINVIYTKNSRVNSVLFRDNTSKQEKIWEGLRLTNKEIKKKYGFSEIYNYEEYPGKILSYLKDKNKIFMEFNINSKLDIFIKKNFLKFKRLEKINIVPISKVTHKLRLRKSNYEINQIKKAVKVSIEAHVNAMKKATPGIYEYELDAEIKYVFNKNNMHFAYMSIVGSGKNACTLHYTKNKDKLKNNDLVLIDAAAENEGYASDITRTFPVNGKFTKEQALIYDIVLNAQEKVIKNVKPGSNWREIHAITIREISLGLMKLKLLPNDLNKVIENKLYQEFFMHKTGHWLGLDVHDVGEYENVTFEPGMIITVEPGIYINLSNKNVPKKWRGIGIRIEDDLLVTKKGNQVLTKKLPKKRDEVELLCNQKT